MRFIIEEAFRSLFPEAFIGIVVASGIDNRRNDNGAQTDLASAVALAAAVIGEGDMATHPAVAPWREADRTKLTSDTTRALLVIEALPPRNAEDVLAACHDHDLAALANLHAGATCRVALLGANGVVGTSLNA